MASEGNDDGIVLVRAFRSRTKPGEVHNVFKEKVSGKVLPELKCSCQGYSYHQRCWHIAQVVKQIAQKRDE